MTQSMNKIAIVGLAARYPQAKDANQFWQNLLDKTDARRHLTAKKLAANPQDYTGKQGESDRFYCDQGGYISDFSFDASGYQLPANELNSLDDSFLWALDCSKKALLDANIHLTDSTLSRCGIVMGSLSFPTTQSNKTFLPIYHKAVEKGLQLKLEQASFELADFQSDPTAYEKHSNTKSHLAVSHSASHIIHQALGLGGNQLSLDAACASSVYAIKLACDYLNTGKADLMLAGAVSGADPFFINMGFSIFHAYPENGLSAPFDANSQGLFAGEGAGVIALKRLTDAERDGDKIYAVISGIGLSNDGKGQFVLSPNSKGQVQAFERAYESAQTPAKDIEVVECHATGTPLGDKVELTSMEQFFTGKLQGEKAPLIGSAKSNLGHLLTAAGMPGIMKMIFAMETQTLPASININDAISSPNQLFSQENIPTQTTPWPVKVNNDRRRAGISVFGFGGCNAHMLLETYVAGEQNTHSVTQPQSAFFITGIGAHFGKFGSVNQIHQAIKNKQSAFIDVPPLRWKGLQQHPELLNEFGLSQVPQGAYIENFDFDFLRYKVPPNEDDRLIAQQLLLIKVADEAIRDANLQAGSKVTVLVAMETEAELHQFRGRVNLHSQLAASLAKQGVSLSDDEYQQLEALSMNSVLDAAKLNQYTSFIGNIMASRISSLWDFNGPAFTISAAEHSVARCLDVAENLMSQEHFDAVVIAAVDLTGSAEQVIVNNQRHSVNIKPNADLNKWNIGEAAGAIVLQATDAQSSGYGDLSKLSFTPQQENAGIIEHNHAIEYAMNVDQNHSSAQQLFGHTFAASGMTSLLNSLLDLPQQPVNSALIRTQAENQYSEFVVEQSTQQQDQLLSRLSQDLTWSDQKHLIKTVNLGGRDIIKHIVETDLPSLEKINNKMTLIKPKEQEKKAQDTSLHWCDDNEQLSNLMHNQALARDAHLAFLKTREQGLKVADALMRQQYDFNVSHSCKGKSLVTFNENEIMSLDANLRRHDKPEQRHPHSLAAIPSYTPPIPEQKPCIWSYHDLVEYAEGDIAQVFGPDYAVIDNYSRRVRLPTSDYLLVSRVTKLDAAMNEFKPSKMTTEYDIPADAPYLVNGQIPWAVAVESGQCDLMLISYLGIDFENKGERVYRLLDCTLTFLGDLPRGGDTLRYDISINHFARNGDTLLFFFSYECFVGDNMILKMDGGCAGFFTDQELADGKGVIRTEDEIKARQLALSNPNKPKFEPLLHCLKTQFNYQQIQHLLHGDVASCFGGKHGHHQMIHGEQTGLSFASQKFLMIEQINQLDIHGGAWGLGFVEGEKQLAPDHWYFPCHFKDDQVMAGSLMAEGCGQLLQFFMLHTGMHTQSKQGRFQPLKGAAQKVRCRGQVLPQHGILTYRMEVTEIGMLPQPYAKANIDILLDGKVVVDFQNLGVMIKEEPNCTLYNDSSHNYSSHKSSSESTSVTAVKTGVQCLSQLQDKSHWISAFADMTSSKAIQPLNFGSNPNAPLMAQIADTQAPTNKGVVPIKHIEAPICLDYPNRTPDTLPYTPYHMFEFATGDIEKCFGRDFSIYRNLIPPRTPCGDLQLTTRVIDIKGQRGDLSTQPLVLLNMKSLATHGISLKTATTQ